MDGYSKITVKMDQKISSLDDALQFIGDVSKASGCMIHDMKGMAFNDKEGKPIMIHYDSIESCITKYLSQDGWDIARSEVEFMFKGRDKILLSDACMLIGQYL